ncbi:hypothetical protein JCM11251_000442 [Rhodosporidiobolus azoricus]
MPPRPRRAAAARADAARAASSTPAAQTPPPAAAPEEPIPIPQPPPPLDVDSATIPLEEGYSPGYTFHANLFFASTDWLHPLRADVEALLAHFKRAWEVASASAGETGDGQKESFSPMEVMKGVWDRKGWNKVHLMGLLDGPVRLRWGQSIVRALVERINPDEEPLKQIAALLALYLFWSTQPDSLQKLFIRVDPPTFEHILALYALHRRLLDSSSSHALLFPPPSADLALALHSLVSQNAFFLVPTQSYVHPSLPCVRLEDTAQAETRDVATVLLGAEEEMRRIKRGELSRVARRAISDDEEDEDETEDEEDEEERLAEDEGDGGAPDYEAWGAPVLRASVARCAQTKLLSSAAPSGQSLSTAFSTLHAPQNRLHLDVLLEAEKRTREALSKLGTAAGGADLGLIGGTAANDDGKQDAGRLLRLLNGRGDGQDGAKRRRLGFDRLGGDGRALAGFEAVVQEMQQER